ncbi:MAG TPA: tetratricopeptide repeat protein, partial [Thermoanaerobaculia bacterium]|nr:tetratricopeptide repeat protein [Thermoanaerobaculia bacterium]
MRRSLFAPLLALAVATGCASPSERRREAFAQSDAALKTGRAGDAVAVLTEYLSYAPRDLAASVRLAAAYESLGRPGDARGALLSVPPDTSTADPSYRRELALAGIRLGDLTGAAALLAALDAEGIAEPGLVEEWIAALVAKEGDAEAEKRAPAEWRLRAVDRLRKDKKLAPALSVLSRVAPETPGRGDRLDSLLGAILESNALDEISRFSELLEPTETARQMIARHRL